MDFNNWTYPPNIGWRRPYRVLVTMPSTDAIDADAFYWFRVTLETPSPPTPSTLMEFYGMSFQWDLSG